MASGWESEITGQSLIAPGSGGGTMDPIYLLNDASCQLIHLVDQLRDHFIASGNRPTQTTLIQNPAEGLEPLTLEENTIDWSWDIARETGFQKVCLISINQPYPQHGYGYLVFIDIYNLDGHNLR